MTLKLIPPGQRKGNAFFIVRGRWNGTFVEFSAKTTDEAKAAEYLDAYKREHPPVALAALSNVPELLGPGEVLTTLSVNLIAPGERKGNKFFLLRGYINGRSFEISTKTTTEREALAYKATLERSLEKTRGGAAGRAAAFREVAHLRPILKRPRGRPELLETRYGVPVAALLLIIGAVAKSTAAAIAHEAGGSSLDTDAWLVSADGYRQIEIAAETVLDALRPGTSPVFRHDRAKNVGARIALEAIEGLQKPLGSLFGDLRELKDAMTKLGVEIDAPISALGPRRVISLSPSDTRFIETYVETCDVAEAAVAAGISRFAGATYLERRDIKAAVSGAAVVVGILQHGETLVVRVREGARHLDRTELDDWLPRPRAAASDTMFVAARNFQQHLAVALKRALKKNSAVSAIEIARAFVSPGLPEEIEDISDARSRKVGRAIAHDLFAEPQPPSSGAALARPPKKRTNGR